MKFHAIATTTLAAGLALATIATTSAAQPDTLERAARELDIMSHIFRTAVEEGGEASRFNYRQGPDARYLAGQGMVFTFNLDGMRNFWGGRGMNGDDWAQFSASMGQMAEEIMASVSASFPDLEFDQDFDFDPAIPQPPQPAQPALQGVPQLAAQSAQLSADQRRAMAEMSKAMREQQQRVQEQQRELRAMQRELRSQREAGSDDADAATEARIEEQQAALELQITALREQQEAYSAYMTEVAGKAREQQEAFNTELTARLVQALCDYGSTLKSLAASEYITMIFEDYGDDQDRIMVFPVSAVADCNDAQRLQQAAVSYQM
jgi:hypothetical protein